MPSTETLLYILLAVGAVYMVYTTVRDLIRKPKEETTPAATVVPASISSTVLPLQLQAYERLTLLIERIRPQNLIGRVYQPVLSSVDMQIALVQTIKSEFDHNVTQQIYVSAAAWDAVKTLKEQTISIINQVASRLPPDAPAKELNRHLLDVFLQAGESPADLTAQIINMEAKKVMH
jgi:hypothetical protein